MDHFIKKEYQKFKKYIKPIPWIFRIYSVIVTIIALMLFFATSWVDIKYKYFCNPKFEIRQVTDISDGPPFGKLFPNTNNNLTFKIFNHSEIPLKPMFVEIISRNNHHYTLDDTIYCEIEQIEKKDIGLPIGIDHSPVATTGKDTIIFNFRSRLDSSLIKSQYIILNIGG
jgi:hypothetical protein